MSELTLTVMRLGFLAVLWLFVIVAVQVIRSDLFGTKMTQRAATTGRRGGNPNTARQPSAASAPQQRQQAPAQSRQRRGAPTHLVITQGSLAGTTVALQGQTITLGRAHDSTIVLDDDYASSRHARIYPDQNAGAWVVEDTGSTNGTFLDNARLTSPTPLQPGSAIRIGRTVIELRK
ncbi:FHA domain-containing protein [Streptacidiphilus pinicola]|uniref:FHA domain-containing protein n=1 Tax=Streptacidiphilus pinicola TaxID=2219663 RepID=A0A2X0JBH6_9ACTN|nr:FHA domain-containing protein [Streptacidiphilus pinicola]RAG84898.1 FHA domain-containing protein [Streptacidiphilus pinicola]